MASFEERRAEIDAQLAAAAAKEGLKPIDDDALLDEVTALVERPNVLLCRFEARVSRRAAGVPRADDEGEPEVLSAARRRGSAHQPFSRRQQRPARRSVADRSGQRARRPAAPRRCQVLLRPGPQAHARIACPGARQGRLPRQARQPGRPRASRAPHRDLVRRADRRRRRGRRPRRAARQGRPADRHGRRVPRAAGNHGRLLRGARRRGAGGGRGDSRPVREPARRRRRRRHRRPRRGDAA